MKTAELIFRVSIFILTTIISSIIIVKSTTLETSIKCVSVLLATLISSSSLFFPSTILKNLLNKNSETESSNADNTQTRNGSSTTNTQAGSDTPTNPQVENAPNTDENPQTGNTPNTVTNHQAGNNSIMILVQGNVNGNIHPIYDAKQERKRRRQYERQAANIPNTENGKEASQPYTGNLSDLQEQIDNMTNCD